MVMPIEVQDPQEEIGLVQGKMPDSINEWHFAQALDKMDIPYIYQYLVGSLGTRGSQWIDFLVLGLAGGAQACYIQGAYWHNYKTQAEDQMKLAVARHMFGDGNVHEFSEEETASREAATASIRKRLPV